MWCLCTYIYRFLPWHHLTTYIRREGSRPPWLTSFIYLSIIPTYVRVTEHFSTIFLWCGHKLTIISSKDREEQCWSLAASYQLLHLTIGCSAQMLCTYICSCPYFTTWPYWCKLWLASYIGMLDLESLYHCIHEPKVLLSWFAVVFGISSTCNAVNCTQQIILITPVFYYMYVQYT